MSVVRGDTGNNTATGSWVSSTRRKKPAPLRSTCHGRMRRTTKKNRNPNGTPSTMLGIACSREMLTLLTMPLKG